MANTDTAPKPRRPPIASKTVAMSTDLIDRVHALADREGHRKFSRVVVTAVEEYLDKWLGYDKLTVEPRESEQENQR